MKTVDVLRKHSSTTKSNWRSEAEQRRTDWNWLRYSAAIALMVRERMSELGMTQVALAEKLSCTQQHVSMLLKGNANLTLETIAKLEDALDFSIIKDAFELVSGYETLEHHRTSHYLSEPKTNYGKLSR